MKVIFTVFFVYLASSAYATDYYFSSVSGNDSRTTSEAQDPSTPWKSLAKLNSFFSSLKPGDAVLLKRGEIFYGSIIVKQSGSTNSPIVVGAYGSGSKPVITSLITLSDWIFKGNGIWESTTNLSSAVNMVLLNDVEQEMGRYPNSNAANKGYLNFESHSGKTSITDNDLNTAINWTGAELVTRPRHWILNRSLVTAQSGTKISYTTTSPYDPYENYGYFIQNSIKALDKLGEWYYNSSAKKISAYFGSADPSSYTMQAASTTSDLVSSSGYSNVVFDNLTVKGSNSSGFFINNGANISLQNCEILFSGITGAIVHGHTNLHIENCTISNSNNNGIDMEYSVNNAVIKNNRIINTALLPGLLQNGEGAGLAVYYNGDGATIEANELHATGFIGITFYGNDVTVKNNVIDSFCFVKDDGGGLYSHGGSTIPVNRKLVNNIIMNGIGAGPGTDQFDKRSVTGIYLDANTHNVEVTGNTVTTCYQGIFIQSTTGITIKNNTVFNNDRQLTAIRRAGSDPVRNSIITQNIFLSKTQDQWTSYIMSSADDIGSFGRFDSNYYARPIDDKVDIYNSRVTGSGTIVENFDLEGWKKKYGKDEASKISAKQIAPFHVSKLNGSNKFVNGGDFTNDIKGVSASSSALSFNTSGILDGGCLQVIPSSTPSSVYMKIGSVTSGKKYFLSYTVKGSEDNNMSISASLKQNGSPYANLTNVQARKINTPRTENELLFSPTTSESSANLNFKLDAKSKYYLDNIEVYEADATLTDPDDSIRFEYNATNANRSIQLNGSYVDVKGKTYSNTIVLQPYTSLVLIKNGSGGSQNIPPTVNITSPSDNAQFAALSSINIMADAGDADGSVTKVSFYNGTTLLDTDNSAPYSITWDDVPAGDYLLTAKATDDDGLVTTSAEVRVSVLALSPPVTELTAPGNNATYTAPATIVISATATDPGGSISKVEFFNDGILLNTDYSFPYSFIWANVPEGNYMLTAKATDNDGLTTTSDASTVSVTGEENPGISPTVNITAPGNNATYTAPATINLSAAANDTDGSIDKVDFFAGTTLLNTDYSFPYTFSWQDIAAGIYTFTARATDNDGLITSSNAVVVTVTGERGAPVVNLTAPDNNTIYTAPATITVSATASDPGGSVTKVELFSGTTLLKTESTAPYSFSWKNVPAGNYSLTAKATDNTGLVTVSAVRSVIVTGTAGNQAPRVTITKPGADTTYTGPATIELAAVASDADGSVTKVQFYNGTTLLKTEGTSPYSYSWKNVPAGNYIVTAKATDNKGLITTSAAVRVLVAVQQAARTSSSGVSTNNQESTMVSSPANSFDAHKKINVPGEPVLSRLTDFKVLPNPAVDIINLYFTALQTTYQKATVIIYDARGVLVKKYPVVISGKKVEADISFLSAGMYIIGLSGDGFTINKKFFKVK